MQAQIEAGEQAKKDLKRAEEEKKAAQEKLSDAVSALAGIRDAQEAGRKALNELLGGQKTSRENQQALAQLLQSLRQDTRQGQDALSQLLQAAIRNQEMGEGKLGALQGLAQDILAAEGNITELVQACNRHISVSKEEQNALIGQLIAWSQGAHQEDQRRLEAIVQASSALQEGLSAIERKVGQLQRTADETQKALEGFRGAWEQDKLNELVELYHQAENLQYDRQFDRAEEMYRQVLIKGGKDTEVYWRIVLCHYGVEYQKDDEGVYLPFLLSPDLTDPEQIAARRDLKQSLVHSPQAAYYANRLEKIDHILDAYREIRNQAQYDVFISVKQSYNGRHTIDSDIASDLYDHLTGLGLRVFNSRRSKRDIPLGRECEPYIISALLSSRVLIVVGTTAEFMNAQWVRNEWSRFQWLIRKEEKQYGRSGRELFCYLGRGMSPHDIPRGLSPSKQAVIDGGDAYAILDAALTRVFSLTRPAAEPVRFPAQPPKSIPAESPKAPPIKPPKKKPSRAKSVIIAPLIILLAIVGVYAAVRAVNGLPPFSTAGTAGLPSSASALSPTPSAQDHLSSYGYVLANSVNLRSGPSAQSDRIKTLDRYILALALSSVTNEEGTWYYIPQADAEGYIMSSDFKVLKTDELSDFLQSSEYQNANGNSANTGTPAPAAALTPSPAVEFSQAAVNTIRDAQSILWAEGEYVAYEDADDQAILLHMTDNRAVLNTPNLYDGCYASQHFIVVCGSSTIYRIDKSEGTAVSVTDVFPDFYNGMTVCASGGGILCFTVYDDRSAPIYVYDIESNRVTLTKTGGGPDITSAVYVDETAGQTNVLFSDGSIYRWDGAPILTQGYARFRHRASLLVLDGQYVAADRAGDGKAVVLSALTGQVIHTFDGYWTFEEECFDDNTTIVSVNPDSEDFTGWTMYVSFDEGVLFTSPDGLHLRDMDKTGVYYSEDDASHSLQYYYNAETHQTEYIRIHEENRPDAYISLSTNEMLYDLPEISAGRYVAFCPQQYYYNVLTDQTEYLMGYDDGGNKKYLSMITDELSDSPPEITPDRLRQDRLAKYAEAYYLESKNSDGFSPVGIFRRADGALLAGAYWKDVEDSWAIWDGYGTPFVQYAFCRVQSEIGLWGVLSRDGSMILPATFQSIAISEDGFIAGRDGKWYIYDRQGQLVY